MIRSGSACYIHLCVTAISAFSLFVTPKMRVLLSRRRAIFYLFFFLQKQAPIYLGGKSPISWIKFLHYNYTKLMTYTTLLHFLEGSTDRYVKL